MTCGCGANSNSLENIPKQTSNNKYDSHFSATPYNNTKIMCPDGHIGIGTCDTTVNDHIYKKSQTEVLPTNILREYDNDYQYNVYDMSCGEFVGPNNVYSRKKQLKNIKSQEQEPTKHNIIYDKYVQLYNYTNKGLNKVGQFTPLNKLYPKQQENVSEEFSPDNNYLEMNLSEMNPNVTGTNDMDLLHNPLNTPYNDMYMSKYMDVYKLENETDVNNVKPSPTLYYMNVRDNMSDQVITNDAYIFGSDNLNDKNFDYIENFGGVGTSDMCQNSTYFIILLSCSACVIMVLAIILLIVLIKQKFGSGNYDEE